MPSLETFDAPAWERELTAYALAYGFLSRVLYAEPDEALLADLSDAELGETWPVEGDDPAIGTGLELLRRQLATLESTSLVDLRVDHCRLFVGPGRVRAAPWESVYRSKEHLIFEAQTLEVREAYRRFGLQAPHLGREPDDHLGLELAFMLHLCVLGIDAIGRQDPAALEEVLAAQRDFLDEHLLRWAPECLELVSRHARTDLYRAAGELALGTLRQAARTLGVDAGTPAVTAR